MEPRAGAHWRCSQIAAGIGAGRGEHPGCQSSTEALGSEREPDTLQDPRRSQRRDQNRVACRNRRRVAGPDLCRHRRAAWSSSFGALRASGLSPRGAQGVHSGPGLPRQRPRAAKESSARAGGPAWRPQPT